MKNLNKAIVSLLATTDLFLQVKTRSEGAGVRTGFYGLNGSHPSTSCIAMTNTPDWFIASFSNHSWEIQIVSYWKGVEGAQNVPGYTISSLFERLRKDGFGVYVPHWLNTMEDIVSIRVRDLRTPEIEFVESSCEGVDTSHYKFLGRTYASFEEACDHPGVYYTDEKGYMLRDLTLPGEWDREIRVLGADRWAVKEESVEADVNLVVGQV